MLPRERAEAKLSEAFGGEPIDFDDGSISGGFTPTKKLVFSRGGCRWFAKIACLRTQRQDAHLLLLESRQYQSLQRLGLCGGVFPTFERYFKAAGVAALVIEYLPGMTWGGPWDADTLSHADRALSSIHSAVVTRKESRSIKERHRRLVARETLNPSRSFDGKRKLQLFESAWDNGEGPRNSRGEIYLSERKILPKEIIGARNPCWAKGSSLVAGDLNLGNIGFGPDGARIVDPLYLNIGNPAVDRVVLGVNVLAELPDTPETAALRARVARTFIVDTGVLAELIVYWVACTRLPADGNGQADWSNFQQRLAVAALKAWRDCG